MKKTSDSNTQIKIGAIISYLSIGFNILAGLLYTPWMIRSIGQSDYGLYTLATSLISMFLLDFGISSAVTKFVSNYRAKNDQEGINNFLGLVYKLYFVISFVIFIVMLAVYIWIDRIYVQLTVQEIARFKVVYAIAALYNLISFPFVTLNGILTSYEEFVPLKLTDLFNRFLIVITTVISLLLGGGLYALVVINALWNLITIVIKLTIIKRKTSIRVNFRYKSMHVFKQLFSFSFWTTIVSISQRFIFNIMPSILAALSGTAMIAIFGVATAIEGYVYIFSSAIYGMFLPKVSRIVIKDNGNEEILPLMIKVGRITLFIVGLLTIGFILLGREFVVTWMGEKYYLAYFCAIFLIMPTFFQHPLQIADMAVIALDKVKYQAYVHIGMAALNMLLSFPLIHFFGVVGAAISIMVAYMFRTIGMTVIYYRVLKINVFKFFKECHIKMAPAFAISLVMGIVFAAFIPLGGWMGLFIKGCAIGLTYCFIMWKFALNQYEKRLFTGLLKSVIQQLPLLSRNE